MLRHPVFRLQSESRLTLELTGRKTSNDAVGQAKFAESLFGVAA